MATPNALFAIFGVTHPDALESKIAEASPWLNLKVAAGQWFLIAPAGTTTKEITDRLGVTTVQTVSNAIVVRVESYFGRTTPSTWEWITAKRGAELGTTQTPE